MTGLQWVGVAIVAAFFGGLFWMTASMEGWWVALLVWSGSAVATLAVVIGIGLALGAHP